MTRAPARARAAGAVAVLFLALLALVFVVAFAARPATIISPAAADDALFVSLARRLAAGEWLGPYNHFTLVKGPGFPAFLALGHLFGLPFPLALALFHLGCSAFAGWVAWRTLGSRLTGAAIFALMLFLPPLYAGDALRATREVFYTSLTLAVVAAFSALAVRRVLRPASGALLTGGLLAWWWLTREEGVWLAPSLALLTLLPVLAPGEPAMSWRHRLRAGAKPLAAMLVAVSTAALLVLAFGLVNWGVYGRFVVNEIKDSAFQGAVDALQEASWAHHREMVPVPAAARAAIYRVSPAFAELNGPALEGAGSGWASVGCAVDRRMCGDIGGGWFLWALRNAAAEKGHHRSAGDAAAFYGRIEREVRAACRDGRLMCVTWRLPFVPPARPDQLDDVGASLLRSLDVATFGRPVYTPVARSDISAPDAAEMIAFLGSPRYSAPRVERRFHGWFVGDGAEWFAVAPGPDVKVLSAQRLESSDLVAHFRSPTLARQRFALAIDCPRAACPVELRVEGGGAFPQDMATLTPGGRALGDAQLFIDSVATPGAELYLRDRLSSAWTRLAAALSPAYRLLVVAGVAAYLALLAHAVLQRRIEPVLVACTALAGAVAARTAVLALIDALSFPAANQAYMLPAGPLAVMFAVVSLHGLASIARARFAGRPDAGRAGRR